MEGERVSASSTFVLPFEVDGGRRSGVVPPLLLMLSIGEVKDAPANRGAAQLEPREQLALMTRLRPSDERVYDGNGHVRRQRGVVHVLRATERVREKERAPDSFGNHDRDSERFVTLILPRDTMAMPLMKNRTIVNSIAA